MCIMWCRCIQAALQINLAWRGHQQILTAYNMRDALRSIVHHHRQLVCPKTVRSQQHKIANIMRQILGIIPNNFIIKFNDFIGNAHAPCWRFFRLPENIFVGASTVVDKTVRAQTSFLVPIFTAAIARIHQISHS